MTLNGQFTKISMILHVWKPIASNGKEIDTNCQQQKCSLMILVNIYVQLLNEFAGTAESGRI